MRAFIVSIVGLLSFKFALKCHSDILLHCFGDTQLWSYMNIVFRYLNSIGPVVNVPIGEAMIAYREKSGDEDSSQTFVPFIAVSFLYEYITT